MKENERNEIKEEKTFLKTSLAAEPDETGDKNRNVDTTDVELLEENRLSRILPSLRSGI